MRPGSGVPLASRLPSTHSQHPRPTIFPYLSKILPHKPNRKTCNTSTWATTAWPLISLRHRGTVIILSATIPELFRVSRHKPTDFWTPAIKGVELPKRCTDLHQRRSHRGLGR